MEPEGWENLLITLKGHKHIVSSVAFSSDNQQILSGSADKTLKLWDVPNGKVIIPLSFTQNG